MKVQDSIQAMQNIAAELNKMPGRIMDSMHNPETKDGVEKVFTDVMQGEHAFTANVKFMQTVNAVEQVLLNDLRD